VYQGYTCEMFICAVNLTALDDSPLSKIKGIKLSPEKDWAKKVYWMYSILIEDEFVVSRDELVEKLREEGIETRTIFAPVHQQLAFQKMNLFQDESYLVAEELSQKGLYLPSSSGLTTEQIEYICHVIKEVSRANS
jgi:perosamine synthetase